MKVKVQIKTPKGQASKTEYQLRPFLIGRKKKHTVFVNKEDDTIVWEIEGSVRDILKVNKNVACYDLIMKNALNSKVVRKALRQRLSTEAETELKSMLLDQTTVEIIKEASAQELVEHNLTWWQRVQKNFKNKK